MEYNAIVKENDELYRSVAKALGLSECTCWILYILRINSTVPTQKEICAQLYEPKQTVHSALKKLEEEGNIELLTARDRRSKLVRLTEQGARLAQKTADKIIEAELRAFAGLSETEQKTFIHLFRKYTDSFKKEMTEIKTERK